MDEVQPPAWVDRTEEALRADPDHRRVAPSSPLSGAGSMPALTGDQPAARPLDTRRVIGGWVPDPGALDGWAADDPVDSDADELGSEPDPDGSSWSKGPGIWGGDADSDGAEEEASSGTAFADQDSMAPARSFPSAAGPTEENSARDNTGDGDGDADPTTNARRRAVRAPRLGRQWGRFAELWVPEPLRDARVDPGRRGALILLMIAALAAVVTAVGVWRNQPEPVPVPMSASAATVVGLSGGVDPPPGISSAPGHSAAEEPAASAVETAPATEIVVSVTGLVRKAGLVTVPPGARVADAIAAAGGATADADLTGMNLAAKLVDGDSIVLSDSPSGSSAPGGGAAPAAAGRESPDAPGSALVNLNTADEAALDSLPGVGPVMAQNILAWRDANGTFTSIEQLQEISGIGPSRYAQISPLVTV